MPPWRRTLYILFVSQVITAIGFSTIFPFLPLYVQELGAASRVRIELLIGLVYSSHALTMMVASPLWGLVADRYGRKPMVERSMFGGALLLLLMAYAQSAEHLVVLRAIQGMVTGTLAATSALTASLVPRERTGYAMGLLQVGRGTGVALGPLLGGIIADTYGYSAAFYATAMLLLVAGLTVHLGVSEDFTPGSRGSSRHFEFLSQWKRIISDAAVTTAYTLRFSIQLGRSLIVPVLPLFVQTLLSSGDRVNTFTGIVIGAAAFSTIVSAVFLGPLGDRKGHAYIIMACATLAATAYLAQSVSTAGWHLVFMQVLVGTALGGLIPSVSALLAVSSGAEDMGTIYGLDNSVNAGARSVAPMLSAIVASWLGLRATFIVAASTYALTAVLGLRVLPVRRATPRI